MIRKYSCATANGKCNRAALATTAGQPVRSTIMVGAASQLNDSHLLGISFWKSHRFLLDGRVHGY